MGSYNINSGFGSVMASNLPRGIVGKTFIVGKAALAYRDIYNDISPTDLDGKARFFATVNAAFAACTANAGDTIMVLPGHTETVTATSIAFNVAGVKVVCLGNASNQAVFTYGAAAATITITGANSSWTGGNFVANFADVVAAFTVGDAVNFRLDGGIFTDTSAILNFLVVIATGATNNQADGLTVVNNYWLSLPTIAGAFVSILANEKRLLVDNNFADKASTSDVGHFITLSSKIISGARITRNTCIVVGATGATVGIFLTGSGTTSTGLVADNRCASLDTTTELMFTASTGLKFFDNYYTGIADKSGYLVPAADSAA